MTDGEDVADGESRFFTAVDKGAGVQAFGGDEGFLAEFVAVGVAEDDTGERSAAGESKDKSFLECVLVHEITHRPESWMISFTIPRTYPLLSA